MYDDVDLVDEIADVEIDGVHAFGDSIPCINLYLIAVNEVGSRVIHESPGHRKQGAWHEHVVGVDPHHILAGGHGSARIDGIALSPIGPGMPVGDPVFILSDDLCALVGGSTVDDDVLQVGVSLVMDGDDGPFQEGGLVEGGSDDRDLRP